MAKTPPTPLTHAITITINGHPQPAPAALPAFQAPEAHSHGHTGSSLKKALLARLASKGKPKAG